MDRVLVFDHQINWIRAAVIEDGQLCEFHETREKTEDPTESLYYGCVKQIRPSLCAAFLDIGEELNAFLPLAEPDEIQCGDFIIVQGAAKQSTDSKGLRVSKRINLTGRSLVLIPNERGVHISKKIKDEALRAELKAAGERICPDGFGMIIRTASADLTEQMLADEAAALRQRWEEIAKKAIGLCRPGLLWRLSSMEERLIRDLSGRELRRIVTNDETQYRRLMAYRDCGLLFPETNIDLFDECGQLVFDAFDIDSKLNKALKRRIWLPCGGYLVIDACEAMTVIDVNSGKMTLGRNIEETAIKVNLEAADEIARQLRLRNVGGMVIADFIDMTNEESRLLVESRLKAAVKSDRAGVEVLGMTRLGLMEMTRKRERAELRKRMRVNCSCCSGVGEVLSGEEAAVRALQQVRRMAFAGQRGPFLITCAKAAADAFAGMINPLDESQIYVLAAGRHTEKTDIEQLCGDMNVPRGAFPLRKRKEL